MKYIFAGNYADIKKKSDIRVYSWEDNVLELVWEVDCPNPSFMAHANGRLYVVSELPDIGYISAYAIDEVDGSLHLINRITVPCRGLCHITVTPDGKMLCAVAYNSGHVLICDILPDGRIRQLCDIINHTGHGIHPRQASPHPHQALTNQSTSFWVPDLGLDQVISYKITPDQHIIPQSKIMIPPGEGPRHIAVHPQLSTIYVLTELMNHILCYVQEDDTYHLKQVVSLADKNEYASSAEILISKDNRFLYASVRGSDKIACMSINQTNGLLSNLEYYHTPGSEPRMFTISSDGLFLFVALQNSGCVAIMRVNKKTGSLTDTHSKVDVPSVCFVQYIDF